MHKKSNILTNFLFVFLLFRNLEDLDEDVDFDLERDLLDERLLLLLEELVIFAI
tara:strand:+ start:231 stop:392 length:162 start_codon:yes stop_codon:yes gene_type:complete